LPAVRSRVGAKVAELDAACFVRDREDAQSNALVDYVVESVGRVAGHAASGSSGHPASQVARPREFHPWVAVIRDLLLCHTTSFAIANWFVPASATFRRCDWTWLTRHT
jgi:hypothetical protein